MSLFPIKSSAVCTNVVVCLYCQPKLLGKKFISWTIMLMFHNELKDILQMEKIIIISLIVVFFMII